MTNGEGALRIHLFGAFRVIAGGVPIGDPQWARKKARTLVKILALDPSHEASRERLIEMLWPDLDPEAGLNNFHKTLHAARRALEPGLEAGAGSRFLVTRELKLALRAPGGLWVDALEFEARAKAGLESGEPGPIREALDLSAAEFLEEDRLEDWAAIPRERMAALRQELLLGLAAIEERAGNWHVADGLLNQAAVEGPLNEKAHRALMKLYAGRGNRHLALAQFRRCAEILKRELDAEPESATVRLFEQIQAGETGTAPRDPEPVPAPVGPLSAAVLPAPARRKFFALAAAGGATLALGAAAMWRAWRPATGRQPIGSLAVLPFQIPRGAAIEHVSEGLVEELISTLSRLPRLRVMARSTVFAYKDKSADPRAAGKAVGVAALLTGTIASDGGSGLRLSVELVDTSDGARLWGNQYPLSTRELSVVQARIANDVAAALAYEFHGDEQKELVPTYSGDPRAHEAYLRGRFHWNQRTETGFRKAIEYFESAIAIDPRYARAFAGLADCHGLLAFSDAPPAENFPKARAMAEKALQLDPRLAEAYTSLAMVKALFDWDWAGAEADFRKAIELNPGHATAHHWYAVHLNAQVRVPEARAEFARAVELDPLSRIIQTNAAYPAHYQRDLDTAIRAYRKVLAGDPSFAVARAELSLALEQAGRLDEAAVEIAQGLTPELAAKFETALKTGGYRAGIGVLRSAAEADAQRRYVSPAVLAHFAIRTGDADAAFRWLDKAVEERSAPLAYLKVNPIYDPIRGDSRFAGLLNRVGLR